MHTSGVPSRAGSAVGVALIGAGQLVLPFTSSSVGIGGQQETVWSVGRWDSSGAGASALHVLGDRLADLWLMPGAVLATLLVAGLTAMAIGGRRTAWWAAAAAWTATMWQIGTCLVIVSAAAWDPPLRPGLGLLASVIGASVLSAVAWSEHRPGHAAGPADSGHLAAPI